MKIKCRQNWGVKGGSKKMGDLKRGDHTLAKSFSTSLINFKNSTCSQISQSSFLCVPDQFILNLLSIKILKKNSTGKNSLPSSSVWPSVPKKQKWKTKNIAKSNVLCILPMWNNSYYVQGKEMQYQSS